MSSILLHFCHNKSTYVLLHFIYCLYIDLVIKQRGNVWSIFKFKYVSEKWKVWVPPDIFLSILTLSWEGGKQSSFSGGCAQMWSAKWMMKVLNGHLDLSCVRSPKMNGLGYMIRSRQTLQYPVKRCTEGNSMKDERKKRTSESSRKHWSIESPSTHNICFEWINQHV